MGQHRKKISLKGLREFKKDWLDFPEAVDYIACTWWPHRESFVHAWTNQVKHHGNRMTNRAKGYHRKLKRHLESGEGSLATVFQGMSNMLCL